MMPGCSSLAEVRASRWKRSTNSLSKARENGRTLIATSRSSCFSRALKTIAIPPRPSSSRISYSSLSCSRTMSISVSSCCPVLTAPMGVVAVRSRPQERQNLLESSFWVPQREQYKPFSDETAETYGPRSGSVNRLARNDAEGGGAGTMRAARGVGDGDAHRVLAPRRIGEIDAPMHAGRGSERRGVELQAGRGVAAAEEPADRREEGMPAQALDREHRVIGRAAGETVHLVVQLRRAP